MTDPSGCRFTLIAITVTNVQLERIQEWKGNIVRDNQVVGEVLKLVSLLVSVAVRTCGLELLVDVEAGYGGAPTWWTARRSAPPAGPS